MDVLLVSAKHPGPAVVVPVGCNVCETVFEAALVVSGAGLVVFEAAIVVFRANVVGNFESAKGLLLETTLEVFRFPI
jgi:hypothetical protein